MNKSRALFGYGPLDNEYILRNLKTKKVIQRFKSLVDGYDIATDLTEKVAGHLTVQNKYGEFIENKDYSHLNPIFKWTGGKRREIKNFAPYFPNTILQSKYKYVEPFVGGGAVYFYLNNCNGENIINDFDELVINFYKQFYLNKSEFYEILQKFGKITDHDKLEAAYYIERDKDKNNGLKNISNIDKAIRFFVVNQLAFSGMRRFNSSGEFNVPFGHYKKLNTDIIGNDLHRQLLKNTSFRSEDFEIIMKDNDTKNTFIFLDPPYTRVFKKYSSDNIFGEEDHIRLSKIFKTIKQAKVMLVIDKSDFTEKLYKDYIKTSYGLKYGVNIKNRFNTDVEHLIICNY